MTPWPFRRDILPAMLLVLVLLVIFFFMTPLG